MWPCETSHRIVISLDGADQFTITLPCPVLSNSINAEVRLKEGFVDIAVRKAPCNYLWPEDVLAEQFRWRPDSFSPWEDLNALTNIHLRDNIPSPLEFTPKDIAADKTDMPQWNPDTLSQVREIIRTIFFQATQMSQLRFQLQMKTSSTKRNNDAKVFCYIRAHPPVRVSSRGSPVLFLSVADPQNKSEFRRVFPDAGTNASDSSILVILATSSEVAFLFLQILHLNSAKIQPTPWQKTNLPLVGEPGSAWTATFIRLLYVDGMLHHPLSLPVSSPGTKKSFCARCHTFVDNLKFCSRCKAEKYCSTDCQRSHWKTHKSSCIEAAGKWKDETMSLVMGPEPPAEPFPSSPSSESGDPDQPITADTVPDVDIRDKPGKVKTRKNAEPNGKSVSISSLNQKLITLWFQFSF